MELEQIQKLLTDLKNNYDIIKRLDDSRVFDIDIDKYDKEHKFYIQEQCDREFGEYLTEEDCIELSDFFKDLAQLIKCKDKNL